MTSEVFQVYDTNGCFSLNGCTGCGILPNLPGWIWNFIPSQHRTYIFCVTPACRRFCARTLSNNLLKTLVFFLKLFLFKLIVRLYLRDSLYYIKLYIVIVYLNGGLIRYLYFSQDNPKLKISIHIAFSSYKISIVWFAERTKQEVLKVRNMASGSIPDENRKLN